VIQQVDPALISLLGIAGTLKQLSKSNPELRRTSAKSALDLVYTCAELRRCPRPGRMSPPITSKRELVTQCFAVTTQLLAMMVPPQKG